MRTSLYACVCVCVCLGCLKNISSAGEAARGDLRRCNGLVDCLLNGIKSSLTSQHSDEKVRTSTCTYMYTCTLQVGWLVGWLLSC